MLVAGVVIQQMSLAVQVAGVAGSAAAGGVASGDRPAPFEEQHVDVGQAGIPGIGAAQVLTGLGQVAVGLQEHGAVVEAGDAVDKGPAVAASAVGGVDTR
ncbi:MAG: hypothetical protein ACRDSH_23320 [Pseudonocardiaceae bacterium]